MHPRIIAALVVFGTLCMTAWVVIYAHFNYRYRIQEDGCLQTVLLVPDTPFLLPSVQCVLPRSICVDRWNKQGVPVSYCTK